ncbi:MAG: hypothetical protein ABIA63_00080, partial [bacterium]
MKKKVIVGMSGGVDSSVTAYLLKDAGYDVQGIFMKIYSGRSDAQTGNGCYGPGEEDDMETAFAVADEAGIPFSVIDLKNEYSATVLDYFKKEYLNGNTPNPCLREGNYEQQENSIIELKKNLGQELYDRARVWRNCQPGTFDGNTIAVTVPMPEAAGAAPPELLIPESAILYAFKEREEPNNET